MRTGHALSDVTREGEGSVAAPVEPLRRTLTLGKRLLRTVEAQAMTVDGSTIRYTVSAGVATMEADISGLDGLIKRADFALYAAKRAGRNRVEGWTPLRTDAADD